MLIRDHLGNGKIRGGKYWTRSQSGKIRQNIFVTSCFLWGLTEASASVTLGLVIVHFSLSDGRSCPCISI